jgi:hypothetical protein
MQAIGSCYFIVYYTKTLAISFIALLQRNDRLTRVRVPIYLCAYIWSDSLSEIDFKNCRLKPFSIYDFLENRIIMRACGRVGARVRGRAGARQAQCKVVIHEIIYGWECLFAYVE